MKLERGVMVMKNGKAWGVVYHDGQSTSYGWKHPEDAPIHDPKYCTKPSDLTYAGSPDKQELETGTIVSVERYTFVEIMEEKPND
jgi:hypothetical protein